jgi:MFS family permease
MSRDLKIVSAAMLAWGLGEGLFYIFQPLYIQQLGADPVLIGTILGINGVVMTLAQIPSGYLADRWGRRPLMRFSWICGAAATWIMALGPSLGWYVAGLLLYGVTSSVMAPLNTYIQGARGQWSVGRAISFVSAAYNIGGIAGPFLGGLVAEAFDLRSVYYVSGAVFTISAAIVMFARKQDIPDHDPTEGDTHLLKNNRFLSLLFLIFAVMFAVTLPQPLAANFLQNQRELSLNRIGQLGSLGGLGSVVLMLVFGHLPAGIAMMIGQAGLMLFSALLWRGAGLLWYGLGYFFLGGFRLCRAMTVAMVRPVVREVEVGLAFGIVESLNSLAFVVAPPLAGFLYDRDPALIFPVSLGGLGLTVVLSLWFVRRRYRFDGLSARPECVEIEVHDEA